MDVSRSVLILDALNVFIRSYCAYPTMSSNGYQMGGCIGFMKTLGRIVFELQPNTVYVIWESGGSSRRRSVYPDYKLNRRPEKLNRFYEDDIPDSEQNRQHQMVALLEMLKHVPVCQVYVPDCEGDDVIAYLCCGTFKDLEKVIVSSDKDLLQLLDDRTKVYNLHKKTYVTAPDVLDEFRITAQNFALAKALCGDKSDNIPGIKGIGFKTAAKLFPFLGSEQDVLLSDVIDYSAAHRDESALYQRVVDCRHDLKRNWKLVFLNGNMLSASQAAQVHKQVHAFRPRVNKVGLVRQLVKEGVNEFDIEGFFYSFDGVDNVEYVVDEVMANVVM